MYFPDIRAALGQSSVRTFSHHTHHSDTRKGDVVPSPAHSHSEHGHVPVGLERVAQLLDTAITSLPEPILIDMTLGAGGHSEYLLSLYPQLSIIGVDRDGVSLQHARERLAPFGDRFCGLHTRFDHFWDVIAETAAHTEADRALCARALRDGIAGALFDLGVSSMQLDQTERGFAYKADAPLDMRMDPTQPLRAADILNTYSANQLARILRDYGDERFADKIARAIVTEREEHPFTSSGRLVELLYRVIPAPTRRTGGHPAKRTFQALRVEVNQELAALAAVIPVACTHTRVGGTVVFLSYQSLEDKIVKAALRQLTTSTNPPGLPVDLPGTQPDFALLTRGAEKASAAEIETNPRAQSVRIRAATRLRAETSPHHTHPQTEETNP